MLLPDVGERGARGDPGELSGGVTGRGAATGVVSEDMTVNV